MKSQTIEYTPDEKFVLEMTREFSAPPETVFAAFANFEAMSVWFGPHGYQVTDGEVNFTEGGTYRLQIPSDEGGTNVVGGVYKKIAPPKCLVFTWKWEPREEIASDEMEVAIEFRGLEGGRTELRLRQTLVPDQEVAEHHGWGWNETFEKLEAVFDA